MLDDDDYDDVDDDNNSNGNQSHEIKLSFPYFNWYSFHSPEIVIKSYLASNNRKNTNCSTSSSQSDSTDQNNNQCNKICNYNSLTTAVDIWSLGSILYMMLTGVPAFSHYESEQFTNDTVLCDNDYRNDPGIEEINFSAELDADYHHTECRNYVSKRKNIDRLFNNNSNGDEVQTSSSAPSSSAQKLILEMLQFNSYDRPTIEMILQSEWMTIDDTALEQYDLSRTKSLLSVWNLRKKHNSKTTADTTETQASTTTPSISSSCDGGFNNESSNASCLFDSNGNNIQPHSTSRIEI